MAVKRILVADDEPYLVRSLSFVLKREGYEVETASDGEEALRKFEAFNPDVVFLDLMMPKKDGYAVCHAIKNDEKFKDRSPYVVILTCKGQDSDRYKGFLQGADEFITKPFSPSEIAGKVKGYFSGKSSKGGSRG